MPVWLTYSVVGFLCFLFLDVIVDAVTAICVRILEFDDLSHWALTIGLALLLAYKEMSEDSQEKIRAYFGFATPPPYPRSIPGVSQPASAPQRRPVPPPKPEASPDVSVSSTCH